MDFLKGKIKLLDRFIIGKYLGTFFYTLCVFVLIIIIFDLSEKLDNFLENDLSLWQIASQYFAGSIPFYVNLLSPLINFIAVIFFTAKMADQTEIVPVLSGGVSFNRFLFPYFISASVIFLITLASNLYLLPYTNRVMNEFTNTYIKRKADIANRNNIHMRLDSNTVVYLETFDNKTKTGYKFNLDKFSDDDLKMKLVAEQIKWDSLSRNWKISNYSVRHINGLNETIVQGGTSVKDTILDMDPNDFSPYENVYTNISTSDLAAKIEKEKVRGSGVMQDLRFEYYKRFLHPLSAYVLTLMGVALSSRKVRGGVGLPLGIGIFLSFIYIVLNQFAQMFATKGGFPPLLAVLFPTIFFAILGSYLLYKAPK